MPLACEHRCNFAGFCCTSLLFLSTLLGYKHWLNTWADMYVPVTSHMWWQAEIIPSSMKGRWGTWLSTGLSNCSCLKLWGGPNGQSGPALWTRIMDSEKVCIKDSKSHPESPPTSVRNFFDSLAKGTSIFFICQNNKLPFWVTYTFVSVHLIEIIKYYVAYVLCSSWCPEQ